jgi:PAS domain S-box-containing protein
MRDEDKTQDQLLSELRVLRRQLSASEEAEQGLRDKEQWFRRLVEHAGDALFVVDRETRVVDVNQRACESLGYSREEMLRLTLADAVVGWTPAMFEATWERASPGDTLTPERTLRRKDGTTFPVDVRLCLVEFGGREYGLTLVRDVSERKRAEEELSNHRDHLAELVAERRDQFEAQPTTGSVPRRWQLG